MDQKIARTPEEMKLLQDEAIKRALEISNLEEEDDYDLRLYVSLLFLSVPIREAARTRGRKLACVEHFREWLKENKLTPRDCGIGPEFVKTHLPEYRFLY